MTTKKNINGSDRYLSYFAGIVLALLSSTWIADLLVTQCSRLLPWDLNDAWRANIAAGLFFAISFANPVGTLVTKNSVKRSLAFSAGGFVFGVIGQILVFTPIAGEGLSNFLHLLVAASVVPMAMSAKQINLFFTARGISLADEMANLTLKITRWPERLLFIMLMAMSFGVFWRLTDSTEQVLLTVAGVLTILTGLIASQKWEEHSADDPVSADFQAWLDLEPEEPSTLTLAETAIAEAKRVLHTMLPGAILFGGMTRLAMDALIRLYPNLSISLNDPSAMWQTLGLIAASGLGLIFFGILASLLFSLMLLQLIGRARNWTNTHLRENCFQLLRTLYFRPIKRS